MSQYFVLMAVRYCVERRREREAVGRASPLLSRAMCSDFTSSTLRLSHYTTYNIEFTLHVDLNDFKPTPEHKMVLKNERKS